MKPINENTFAIPVPMDAHDFKLKESILLPDFYEDIYLISNGKELTLAYLPPVLKGSIILGTITNTECSFDLTDMYEDVKGCNCGECFGFVKEKIEIATGYLFENPVSHPIEIEPTSRNHYEAVKSKWQQYQDRVIEKLLIIKKKC